MKKLNNEIYYTIQEAADYLGVSYQTVRNYINKGYLKPSTFGKPYLIQKKDIDKMIESK
jgi:excisionase family DNA binding protein